MQLYISVMRSENCNFLLYATFTQGAAVYYCIRDDVYD